MTKKSRDRRKNLRAEKAAMQHLLETYRNGLDSHIKHLLGYRFIDDGIVISLNSPGGIIGVFNFNDIQNDPIQTKR